ncbi:hypothetical protein [Methanoregula sp.]|uniref:hypothetical protein n=1 Tax=Methanoregula sp. TaxID=2052170 RepID=UPI002CD819AC|nr:hypothetical protein [Methanoregula sp.]HVP96925.1 hypothetical protein [Methanoregula sp.]
MTDTKIQEIAPPTSGAGTSVHTPAVAPKVVSSPVKHVKALKHASHKIWYRKDHPKAGAGVKTPSDPAPE